MSDNVIKETISYDSPVAPVDDAPAPEAVEAPEAELPQAEPQQEAPDKIWESRMNEFMKRDSENQTTIRELKEQLREFQELQKLKETDPLAALAKVGLSSDDIINKALGLEPDAPDPVSQAMDQIKKLTEELEAIKNEKKQTAEQQAIESFKSQISETIKSKADEFEFCALSGEDAIAKAMSVVDYEFQQSGQIIPIETALQHVEAYYESEAKRLAAAKKLAKQTAQVQDTPQSEKPLQQAPSTLTAKTQSVAPRVTKPLLLQIEESKKQAADLLRWND